MLQTKLELNMLKVNGMRKVNNGIEEKGVSENELGTRGGEVNGHKRI